MQGSPNSEALQNLPRSGSIRRKLRIGDRKFPELLDQSRLADARFAAQVDRLPLPFLDNILAAHGRMAFAGDRTTLVAMG